MAKLQVSSRGLLFSARIADLTLPNEKFLPLLALQFLIFDKVS